MDKKQLQKILENHALWLKNECGESANLRSADLRSANLRDANLWGADLRNADLWSANLRNANLRDADLWGADLQDANLWGADLRGADLRNADLYGADLRNANLYGADLRNANLRDANLRDANLPSPTMVLLANWGEVSNELCVELMRYDANNHPNPKKFDEWRRGGPCPYNNVKIQRVAHFIEQKTLWKSGPSKPAYELMVMVLREHCKTDL